MPRISYRECFVCVGFCEMFCCLASSEMAGFDSCSKAIWPKLYTYPRFPFKKTPPSGPGRPVNMKRKPHEMSFLSVCSTCSQTTAGKPSTKVQITPRMCSNLRCKRIVIDFQNRRPQKTHLSTTKKRHKSNRKKPKIKNYFFVTGIRDFPATWIKIANLTSPYNLCDSNFSTKKHGHHAKINIPRRTQN